MTAKIGNILNRENRGLALLIDPDKHTEASLHDLAGIITEYPPDLLLVGGSLLFNPIDDTILFLKNHVDVPLYIFPGDVSQLSDHADGIFLLSLISGRNADYLIGNHVIAAPRLSRSGIDVVPTGYMLIENGRSTSVEYVSNTKPIPFGKTDLAVATALAGELLGMKMIYLEAGSGAAKTVGVDMITEIRRAVSIPLIVGGGIRTPGEAEMVYNAGADLIVIGTALEEYPEMLRDFILVRDRMNK